MLMNNALRNDEHTALHMTPAQGADEALQAKAGVHV